MNPTPPLPAKNGEAGIYSVLSCAIFKPHNPALSIEAPTPHPDRLIATLLAPRVGGLRRQPY